MFKTALNRFYTIGLLESVSFLFLLLIAMPLKYFANFPQAVHVVGWIHGILFVLYVLASIHVAISARWSILRLLIAFIAAFLPFGPHLFNKWLRKQDDNLSINPQIYQ
ncbi:DUF3817 domain-containing protein [Bacillus sp. Marseille-P3661]|uniref:DUF3817 domain-containing protein n=1 Tax=Bacillus sp. Marseille-P3661 TaxID=1936234 RepID=UPI000C8593C6|nr:DUF3817 domain-containing protein [Bacillus sp. Marseille-P3661]